MEENTPTNKRKQQQYKIVDAYITADRIGGPNSTSLDVRTRTAEFNIYETLDKCYLTGTVTILDDGSFFDALDMQGTERFFIRMASVDNETDIVFERTFIMTSIEKAIKSSPTGKSSMYVFTLIEEHGFLGRVKKISRSFDGRLDGVVARLAAREMGKNIDISYSNSSPAFQGNIKGIVPNITPIEALQWLTARATTETGSPFFLYASMHDDNLRLGNLDVMLQQDPWNNRLPYTYNPSNISVAESQTELEKTFTIKALKTSKMANTLKLFEAGAVSANYANTNLNTGQVFSQRYSIRNVLKTLNGKNIIGDKQNVFDESFFLGSDKLGYIQDDLLDAKKYHTITSSGTYGRFKSYGDEFEETNFRKKLESRGLKNHLHKNIMNVVVEGAGFIISKATVGDIVRLNIINDNVNVQNTEDEKTNLDARLSGNFIIYDTRHTFQGTQHTVSMNVCKLERLS